MKCNILNSDLILYAERSLPAERRDLLESHVSECEECRAFLAFLVKSMTLIDKDKETDQNPFLYTRIMAKMEADEKQTWSQHKSFIPALVFSAIFLAGILGGIKIGKLYSGTIPGYYNDLQEEVSYFNDISQESIETFFIITNEDVNE